MANSRLGDYQPPAQRTRYKGALRDWALTDLDNDSDPLALRVAYIHSSEEAAQVAQARERALQKAEDALTRVRNGLGGRYYKTRRQIERRIGQILATNLTGLIDAKVTTRNGRRRSHGLTSQNFHDAHLSRAFSREEHLRRSINS